MYLRILNEYKESTLSNIKDAGKGFTKAATDEFLKHSGKITLGAAGTMLTASFVHKLIAKLPLLSKYLSPIIDTIFRHSKTISIAALIAYLIKIKVPQKIIKFITSMIRGETTYDEKEKDDEEYYY